MLDSSNGIKHKECYLHPWNNLPQNAVQTSSPLWRAQRPEDSAQTQEEAVLMGLFTSTTGSSQNAADVYGTRHWYWQHPLSPCKLCSICRLACCIRRRWAPPRTGTAVSGCLRWSACAESEGLGKQQFHPISVLSFCPIEQSEHWVV